MDAQIKDLLRESRKKEINGDFLESMRFAIMATQRAEELQDRYGLCGGYINQAIVHYRFGNFAEAIRLAESALGYAADSADSVRAMLLLGLCAAETGDLQLAEEKFHQAADISRLNGDSSGRAWALHNLAALVYLHQGKYDLALEWIAESNRILLEIHEPNWGSAMLSAHIYQLQGRREQAYQSLVELRELVKPGSFLDAFYFYLAGELALDEGDPTRAGEYLRLGRLKMDKTANPQMTTYLNLALSRLHRFLGETPAARAWADEALILARRKNARLYAALAQVERAQVAILAGDLESARSDLLAAREVLILIGAAGYLAHANLLLTAISFQQQDSMAEEIWLETARQITAGGFAFWLERERALAYPLLTAYLHSQRREVRQATELLLVRLEKVAPLPLHVVGLGEFSVRQGNHLLDSPNWSRRKAGELFRFLLIQSQHRALKEVVMDALWPGNNTDSAKDLFYQATTTLRRILEPDLPPKFPSRYLVVHGEWLSLILPSGSTLDFEIFERSLKDALRNNLPDSLESCLNSYHAELFPLDRYADWVVTTRQRLADLYQQGLLALAHVQLASNHATEALHSAQALLKIDPWQEDAVLIGMQACLAMNDRPGALRLFRNLEQELNQHLEISPRKDLIELSNKI